ncbi:MAG: hypothetical protein ABGX16_17720 [Pirellulales bacterium]
MKLQLPTVLVNRYAPGIALLYAVSDNRSGTHMATCHLLKNGHKNIACLIDTPGTQKRIVPVKLIKRQSVRPPQ